jgi:hypothetical protein
LNPTESDISLETMPIEVTVLPISLSVPMMKNVGGYFEDVIWLLLEATEEL